MSKPFIKIGVRVWAYCTRCDNVTERRPVSHSKASVGRVVGTCKACDNRNR